MSRLDDEELVAKGKELASLWMQNSIRQSECNICNEHFDVLRLAALWVLAIDSENVRRHENWDAVEVIKHNQRLAFFVSKFAAEIKIEIDQFIEENENEDEDDQN